MVAVSKTSVCHGGAHVRVQMQIHMCTCTCALHATHRKCTIAHVFIVHTAWLIVSACITWYTIQGVVVKTNICLGDAHEHTVLFT